MPSESECLVQVMPCNLSNYPLQINTLCNIPRHDVGLFLRKLKQRLFNIRRTDCTSLAPQRRSKQCGLKLPDIATPGVFQDKFFCFGGNFLTS
ncbi:hypothetical protein D9M68_617430 [compost metagenome]